MDTPFGSQQIYLDSDDADLYIDGKISDCVFTFKDIIIAPPEIDILLSVVNITIPISWYTIDTNTDTIVWSLNSVNQTNVSLTHGNYSATDLLDHLNTQFGGTITVSYDDVTSKFTFTHDSLDFVIKEATNCLSQLGFSTGNHSSSDSTLLSNNIVDLSGVKTVQLRSNFTTNSLESKTKGVSTILAKIPVPLSSGSILVYTNKTGFKSKLSNTHINYIRLRLEDNDNVPLELNGIEWSCVLQIDYQKQRRYVPKRILQPPSLKDVIAQELVSKTN